MHTLEGRVALITGAASGIGRATAVRLHALGAALGLVDIDAAGLQEVERELGRAAAATLVSRVDVSDAVACRRMVAEVQGRFGRVDVLVNSAGVVRPGPLETVTDDDVEREIRVNLLGVIHASRAVLPVMRQQGCGHIVSIASMAALTPVPGEAVYCASKYGVRGFSLALALELRRSPIRVSVIHPDAVDTPMLAVESTRSAAPLAFSGTVLSPAAVVDAVVRVLQTGQRERSVPASRGWLAALVGLIPPLHDRVVDRLERAGARELARRRQQGHTL